MRLMAVQRKNFTKKKFKGNALIEYAVPLAIILVAAGVAATVLDINSIMAQYFAAASGHGQGAIQGSTFKPQRLGESASGGLGTGAAGFGGGGGGSGGGGLFAIGDGSMYRGSMSESGLAGNGGDFVYGITGQGPLYEQAQALAASGASQEYVSNVLGLANQADVLGGGYETAAGGGSQSATAQQHASLEAAQQAAISYGLANTAEVEAHGGWEGYMEWNGISNDLIAQSEAAQNNISNNAEARTTSAEARAALNQSLNDTLMEVAQAGYQAAEDIPPTVLTDMMAHASDPLMQQLLLDLGVDPQEYEKNQVLIDAYGSDGSGLLMNESVTQLYVNDDWRGHKEALSNEYQAIIEAELAAQRAAEEAAKEDCGGTSTDPATDTTTDPANDTSTDPATGTSTGGTTGTGSTPCAV